MRPANLPYTSEKHSLLWELTRDNLKAAWAPITIYCEKHESQVVKHVGTAFLEDMPNIVRAQDIPIPSSMGDETRALMCFHWLTSVAIPLWVQPSETASKVTREELHYAAQTLRANHSDHVTALLLMLYSNIPEPNKIHRRSVYTAQAIGIRAIYRGALQHPNTQIHMNALMAANILTCHIPSQDTPLLHQRLHNEGTQSSALTLLDNLLIERNSNVTTDK
jgi:hypothetical protein